MRRPQFTLKTMLWLVVVAAAFFGGAAIQRQMDDPFTVVKRMPFSLEEMTLRDGTVWVRVRDRRPFTQTLTMPDGTRWHRTLDPDGTPLPP